MYCVFVLFQVSLYLMCFMELRVEYHEELAHRNLSATLIQYFFSSQ